MFRKLASIVFIFTILLLAVSCDIVRDMVVLEGTGTNTMITEDYIGFDQVEASHSFEIEITQGDEYYVEARVDEAFLDYIEITKRGNTLVFNLKDEYSYRFANGDLEATIIMPQLSLVRLSGASSANVEGFDSNDRFEVELSGSSTFDGNMKTGDFTADVSGASDLFGEYSTGDLDLTASGASEIQMSGAGGSARIDASGSSTVDLENFKSSRADIEASGASEVAVNASETVDVNASGASKVRQYGEGSLGNIDTSGASSVDTR